MLASPTLPFFNVNRSENFPQDLTIFDFGAPCGDRRVHVDPRTRLHQFSSNVGAATTWNDDVVKHTLPVPDLLTNNVLGSDPVPRQPPLLAFPKGVDALES